MRILIGMPAKGSRGGTIYCEPPFVRELKLLADVDEEVYVHGEGATPTTTLDRIRRVLDAARRLKARTREKRYDIIQLNTSFDERCVLRDLVTFFFLRRSQVPVFLKMHGSNSTFLASRNPFWRFMQRRVFKLAVGIGVLSSEERANFINAGCPAGKLQLVRNAVEPGDFVPDNEFRSRHGIGSDAGILLFSSRFVPTKGLLTVIRALSVLRQQVPDFVLFCLGDGPVRAEAEALVLELRLGKLVRFTGYIPESETSAYHANSTVFVFPSYPEEGLSIVLLKSLAAGLPIVTTRIRAAADYMSEPENCLWTAPRDPEFLAQCIAKLLDDPELRRSMAENNRRLAEHFTAESVAAEYIELYRRLTGISPPEFVGMNGSATSVK